MTDNDHDWKFLSSHGNDVPGQSLDSYSQCVWCSALKHDYAHGGGMTSPNYPMVHLRGDTIAFWQSYADTGPFELPNGPDQK